MSGTAPKTRLAPQGFELWDERSRNLMGDFDTEEEALAALSYALEKYGPEYARSIVLIRVGPRGGLKRVADGDDLAVRAREVAASARTRVAIESQPLGSPKVLLTESER
jgi:hypothetical protein